MRGLRDFCLFLLLFIFHFEILAEEPPKILSSEPPKVATEPLAVLQLPQVLNYQNSEQIPLTSFQHLKVHLFAVTTCSIPIGLYLACLAASTCLTSSGLSALMIFPIGALAGYTVFSSSLAYVVAQRRAELWVRARSNFSTTCARIVADFGGTHLEVLRKF